MALTLAVGGAAVHSVLGSAGMTASISRLYPTAAGVLIPRAILYATLIVVDADTVTCGVLIGIERMSHNQITRACAPMSRDQHVQGSWTRLGNACLVRATRAANHIKRASSYT